MPRDRPRSPWNSVSARRRPWPDRRPPRQHAPHRLEELLVGERLRQVVPGSELQRLDRALDRGVAGDDDQLDPGVPHAHLADQVDPREPRHPHVGHHQVHRHGIEQRERIRGARRGVDGVALQGEIALDQLERVR